MMSPKEVRRGLSPLEHEVMKIVWERGPSTAEEVRRALAGSRELKESTVRTLLRRMEDKGFVTHRRRGRVYVYRAAVAPERAAVRAVRQIIDRFCEGSVEALLLGMVKDDVMTREDLLELAGQLADEEDAS